VIELPEIQMQVTHVVLREARCPQCGRLLRDAAGTFARTLEREMGALWTFVVEAGVEPANNRAERALRFAVLWRKMMQGLYNAKGDH